MVICVCGNYKRNVIKNYYYNYLGYIYTITHVPQLYCDKCNKSNYDSCLCINECLKSMILNNIKMKSLSDYHMDINNIESYLESLRR